MQRELRMLRANLAAASIAATSLAPFALDAQPTVIRACWVAGGSGVIYRIDTVGAPTACTRAAHKPIQWLLGTTPQTTVIPIPLNLTASAASALLGLTNLGDGGAIAAATAGNVAAVRILNTGAGDNARAMFAQSANRFSTVEITNVGAGRAILAHNAGPNATISAVNRGTEDIAQALYAESRNANTTADFENKGSGLAIYAQTGVGTTARFVKTAAGTGPTAQFDNTAGGLAIYAQNEGPTGGVTARFVNRGGTGAALELESRGSFATLNVGNVGTLTGLAIRAGSNGPDATGFFTNDHTGPGSNALVGISKGTFAAARFENQGSGIALRAVGGAVVEGNFSVQGNTSATGTKSAVVRTSTGVREFYTEEATEVWFADYGSGRVRGGRAWVPLDSTFAETVVADSAYHVFVQPYGEAALYVSRRTTDGFEVRAAGLDAAAPDVEFSFRLVARRRGFQDHRLRLHPTNATTAGVPEGR